MQLFMWQHDIVGVTLYINLCLLHLMMHHSHLHQPWRQIDDRCNSLTHSLTQPLTTEHSAACVKELPRNVEIVSAGSC